MAYMYVGSMSYVVNANILYCLGDPVNKNTVTIKQYGKHVLS